MDGSISIGIELKDQHFTDALNRLRRAAEQTAMQGFQAMVQSLNAISAAFGRTASVGVAWSRQITGAFGMVTAGASALAPKLNQAGQAAAYQFMAGLSSVDGQGAGKALAMKALAGFSIGDYYGAGARAALQLAEGLGGGGAAILTRARSLAYGVSGAFSGSWYSVGYNIAAGIAYGISGGSGAIRSAAVSAAQNALYWAKRALGIRSPSRVFQEEVGKMIPAGIAEGIDRGQRRPREALRRQSRLLVQTAKQDVIPSLSRSAAGGTGSLPVSGGQEMKIRLEAPLYVDGRELARATARYTGQQLAWEAM